MAFCRNCGGLVEDGVKFCPSCGARINASDTDGYDASYDRNDNGDSFEAKAKEAWEKLNNTEDRTWSFDAADVEGNKLMAALSYLSWLVLIPLFAARRSAYARFHVNQGLVLAIAHIAVVVALSILKGLLGHGLLRSVFNILGDVVGLAFFVLAVMGIVNALQGKAKELPVFGQYRILK